MDETLKHNASLSGAIPIAGVLPGVLVELSSLLADPLLSADRLAQSVDALHARLLDARFHLAILGQFKRGKSTFANALLDARVLPSGIVPVTVVATDVAWGPTPAVRIALQSGATETVAATSTDEVHEQLLRLVTEAGNPLNRLGVAWVEVFLPAEVLRGGLVLVDTPGIGSTLRHNTAAAVAALPECDAALLVVSADPPITEAEMVYVAQAREHVVRLEIVLNKIDNLSAGELQEAEGFLRAVLSQAGLPAATLIFPVSARAVLDGGVAAYGLPNTGVPEVRRWIQQDLAQEKAASLHRSVARKALAIADQAFGEVLLRSRALEMPLSDLEARAAAFSRDLKAIEAERQAASDLLAGDRARMATELEERAEQLRRAAWEELTRIADAAIARAGRDLAAAREALGSAIPEFFRDQFATQSAAFRQAVGQRLSLYRERSDVLIASVRAIAAGLFDVPLPTAQDDEPVRLGPDPYWVTEQVPTTMIGPPSALLSGFLGRSARERRRRAELDEALRALIARNVENLRWSMLRGLDESFRIFATSLDQRLAEAKAATEGAILLALERRRSRAQEVEAELRHLWQANERLSGLRHKLMDEAGSAGWA